MDQRNALVTAGATSQWQVCASADCGAVPVDKLDGRPVPSDVRRWWCPEHRHLAGETDMQQRQPPFRLSPSGALVEVNEAEEAREAVRAASRGAQRDARQAERQLEAEEWAAAKRSMDYSRERELPPHLRQEDS